MQIGEIKKAAIPYAEKYGVKTMSIFGSYAAGQETASSDIDFLVEFFSTPSIFKVMGLREELMNALNKKVDIVTLPLSRPDLLNVTKSEKIYG